MSDQLRDWEDWRLAQELRFRLRFEHAGTKLPVDMHSQILCEAVARILERPAAPEAEQNDRLKQDMAMLIRRMARRLQLTNTPPNVELAAKAMDFLQRKGLQGSVLRGR